VTALLAVFLALPGDLPWQDEEPGVDPFLRVRAGFWASEGFDFEAFRLDGRRSIEGRALFTAGIDAGAILFEDFLLWATAEESVAQDARSETVGLSAGYRMKLDPMLPDYSPDEFLLYGGALWGRFDVDEPGFGSFEDGLGGRVGMSLAWTFAERFALQLILEYRFLSFHYEEPAIGGDERAGGNALWGGLGLEVRF
jgi:hypothetical protein